MKIEFNEDRRIGDIVKLFLTDVPANSKVRHWDFSHVNKIFGSFPLKTGAPDPFPKRLSEFLSHSFLGVSTKIE